MKIPSGRLLTATLVLLSCWSALSAADGNSQASLDALQARNQNLEQRLANLEKMVYDRSEAKTNMAAVPDGTFQVYWKDGVRLDTCDKKVQMKVGGRAMIDWTIASGTELERELNTDLEGGPEVRRARLYWSGKMYDFIGWKWQMDFAGGSPAVKDMYLELLKLPVVGTFRAGHFKEPFGMGELTSSKYTTFIERSAPTEAFSPSRNIGVMLYRSFLGEPKHERMTYAAGLFQQTDDSGRYETGDHAADGSWAVTGRVTGLPYYDKQNNRLVHVGGAYSYRGYSDTGGPEFRVRARPESHLLPRFTDTGAFWASDVHLFGAELATVLGPFHAESEFYAAVYNPNDDGIGDQTARGWYVQAGYFLTGESRPYDHSEGAFGRVKPKKNFRQDGGWGAWEVAARLSYTDLEHGQAALGYNDRTMLNGTFGVNWYLNPNVRMMFNYVHSCLDGDDLQVDADMVMWRMQFDF